jgi:Helix-hairpin-helix motif
MLSSQTKDEVTDAAVSKLRTALGGSLSIQGMIDTEEEAIAEAIAKVGFWRRKTGFVTFHFSPAPSFLTLSWNAGTHHILDRYLKKAALKLRDEFDSDVPKTVDELCSLPGVGPKMAFLALQIAWNLCFTTLAPLEISSYYLFHVGIMELAWTFTFTESQTYWGGINRQRKILNKLGNVFFD